MSELVPDAWRFQDDEDNLKCCHTSRRAPRKGPVTDILLWIECYSILVGVLTTKYPAYAPDLMAYQRTIVHAHRSFAGDGWVTYDMCYRRNASLQKSLQGSLVDFTLYNQTFTGKAKPLARCKYCLSDYHKSYECAFAPQTSTLPQKPNPPDTCYLFNTRTGNQCKFKPCRYAHICSRCHGPHPAVACNYNTPPSPKYPRTDTRSLRPARP